MKIKIGLVFDNILFRKGLVLLINTIADMTVVMEADNSEDLEKKLKKIKPDVVLLVLDMSNRDAYKSIDLIREKYPDTGIIVFSQDTSEVFVIPLKDKGVNSLIFINDDIEIIEKLIRKVKESPNDFFFNGPLMMNAYGKNIYNNGKQKNGTKNNYTLDEKDFKIIKLICKKYNTKAIAEEVCLSDGAVNTRRAKINMTLGIASGPAALIEYAIHNNLS